MSAAAAAPCGPAHRVFFDPALWEGGDDEKAEAYARLARRAAELVWLPKGLTQKVEEGEEVTGRGEPASTTDPPPPPPAPFGEFAALLRGASVVVGMHPDQAAGAIVDFCVAHRKPYCVVPCCTFAAEFPRRRLIDGRSVRSYDDLVAWLRQRDPGATASFLDFEGRNVVLHNTFAADAA